MKEEEFNQIEEKAKLKNKTSALWAYLSRHSFRTKDESGTPTENFRVDIESLDIEELTYVTRVTKDEMVYFIQRLAAEGILWEDSETVNSLMFNLRPILLFTEIVDLFQNENFDKQGPHISYKPGWQPGQTPKLRKSRNVLKRQNGKCWQEVEFDPPGYIQL